MAGTQTVNGLLFALMMQAGYANLRANAQSINDLNVFPIPDGDTGDNMLLTMQGGAGITPNEADGISDTSRRIANGMLLSARGNSGVILSQIFEGIAEGLEGVEEADGKSLIHAFQEGVRRSYSAVMEPTEGTMLTVFRCATEQAAQYLESDTETVLKVFIKEAKNTLEKTPDMLPVLKKAGVVDSGGAGIVCIAEGMLSAMNGEPINAAEAVTPGSAPIDIDLFTEDSVLEFGYCTELLIRLQTCKTDVEAFDVSVLTECLKDVGNSIAAFKNGSAVKLHIHTMTPDTVLAFCRQYGEFLTVKIENMSLQHNNVASEKEEPESERKPFGVVAVASGDGIKEMFTQSGADVTVDGGQSMNPSAEELMHAFDRVNADTVFVLPNNSNIVLAAKQAAELYTRSNVRVIESHTIGDGYAALSMLSYESGDADIIEQELTDAMQGVVTAEISRSVRDTEGVTAGDYIGFVGKNILAVNRSRFDAACATVDSLADKEFDICILIRGKDASAEETAKIEEYISSKYPRKEVYTIEGMQDIYDYILILE